MSMRKKMRKECFVPSCKNTEVNKPDLLFVTVPFEANKRLQWFKAVKHHKPKFLATYYCCEIHFDLEEDFISFGKCKNRKCKPIILPHAIPRYYIQNFKTYTRLNRSSFDPNCGNSERDCPEKLIIKVLNGSFQSQQNQFSAVGMEKLPEIENYYSCENHFDLSIDSVLLPSESNLNKDVLKKDVMPLLKLSPLIINVHEENEDKNNNNEVNERLKDEANSRNDDDNISNESDEKEMTIDEMRALNPSSAVWTDPALTFLNDFKPAEKIDSASYEIVDLVSDDDSDSSDLLITSDSKNNTPNETIPVQSDKKQNVTNDSVNIKNNISDEIESKKVFLLNLLPYVIDLSHEQMEIFKTKIYSLIKEIKCK